MNRSYKIAFVNVDKNTTLCEMTGRDILRRREKNKTNHKLVQYGNNHRIFFDCWGPGIVATVPLRMGDGAGGRLVNLETFLIGVKVIVQSAAHPLASTLTTDARARERERVEMIRTNFVIRPKSNFSSLHNGLVQLCKSKRIASLIINAELVERRRIQNYI